MYQRSPDLTDRVEPFFKGVLVDKDQSVVFVGLTIWKEILCKVSFTCVFTEHTIKE